LLLKIKQLQAPPSSNGRHVFAISGRLERVGTNKNEENADQRDSA
jgi:hypothetical protein